MSARERESLPDGIRIGDRPPPIPAADREGRPVSIGDYSGQWLVVYFYPRDNTSGCTREARDFDEHLQSFRRLGASVVGVSPDSPRSHRGFAEKHDLRIELLSDPAGGLLEACGAVRKPVEEGRRPSVRRSTMIVDPDGVVAAVWHGVTVSGHATEVLERLGALVTEREARGRGNPP